MPQIRPEMPADIPAVRRVHAQAFGRSAEADLVDRLRAHETDALSLVAVDDTVVGHILFTPVRIDAAPSQSVGMGLAPVAVLPEFQRQGIGSRLVRRGLELLRQRSCPYVIVLGHPEFYPRFGFEPASRFGLASPWPGVPEDAFLVAVLDREAMTGVGGIVRYRAEFDDVA